MGLEKQSNNRLPNAALGKSILFGQDLVSVSRCVPCCVHRAARGGDMLHRFVGCRGASLQLCARGLFPRERAGSMMVVISMCGLRAVSCQEAMEKWY